MKLKSTLVFTLLLAMAAIPALAADPMAAESVQDVGIYSDGTPSTPVSAHQDITHTPGLEEPAPELPGIDFIEVSNGQLTCEEIQGTPCLTSAECGSCYPTPVCPLTPCYCGYGVCQCDVEAMDE